MTTILLSLFVVASAGLTQAPSASAPDEITRVRELYALAAYEDALARLDAAGAGVSPIDAAQYRALCLLGLTRVVEAEQTMERFVVDYPEYAMTDGEVSPRLVTLFQEARARVVPATARARYSEAKSAYDRGQYARAARAFRDVILLLGDDEFVGGVEGLRDLKLLTEGFLGLAEGELDKAERAAAAPAPATPAPAPAAAPAATTTAAAPARTAEPPAPTAAAPPTASAPTGPEPIYSDTDPAVISPIEVSRWMPAWNPPAVMARTEYRGVLEVVVASDGTVSSASLVRPVHPLYDAELIDATSRWRFQPATRDGSPVAYRRTFEIVLGRR